MAQRPRPWAGACVPTRESGSGSYAGSGSCIGGGTGAGGGGGWERYLEGRIHDHLYYSPEVEVQAALQLLARAQQWVVGAVEEARQWLQSAQGEMQQEEQEVVEASERGVFSCCWKVADRM